LDWGRYVTQPDYHKTTKSIAAWHLMMIEFILGI